MSGYRVLAISYCCLIFIGLGYSIISSIFGKSGEFEYWIIGNLTGILLTQIIACLIKENKMSAYFIGFGTIPIIIVSYFIGYFYFFQYRLPSIYSYQKTAFFLFLSMSFVVAVISSMIFISKSIKGKRIRINP